MQSKIKLLFIIAASMAFASRVAAQAPPCGDFTIFEDGTPALSEEVNCNFELNSDAIEINRSRSLSNSSVINELQPAHIITVAKSGGNFTKLSDAMDSIQAATTQSPYLIRIAPGTYVESSGIPIKSNVYVEGAGQGLTTLQCNDPINCSALLFMNITGRTRISGLSIIQYGASRTGVSISGDAQLCDIAIEDIEIRVEGTGGINLGISASSCNSVSIKNTKINVEGGQDTYGISSLELGDLIIDDTDVSASEGSRWNIGIDDSGSTDITIRRSRFEVIRGTSARALNSRGGATFTIRDSEFSALSGAEWNYALRLIDSLAYVTGTKLRSIASQNANTYFAYAFGSTFFRISHTLIDGGTAYCPPGDHRCFYCQNVNYWFLYGEFTEQCAFINDP